MRKTFDTKDIAMAATAPARIKTARRTVPIKRAPTTPIAELSAEIDGGKAYSSTTIPPASQSRRSTTRASIKRKRVRRILKTDQPIASKTLSPEKLDANV